MLIGGTAKRWDPVCTWNPPSDEVGLEWATLHKKLIPGCHLIMTVGLLFDNYQRYG